MITILKKQSKYKKYGDIVALVWIEENDQPKSFTVAYNYVEIENSKGYADTPKENIFVYQDENEKVECLKQAIAKFESIKC